MSDALSIPVAGLVGPDGRPVSRDKDHPFWLNEEQDAKESLFAQLRDLDDIEVFYNWVLVAKYIREEIGAGLVAAAETQREDVWQGSVGLILKKGPAAFVDDGPNKFYGADPQVGDWVIYRNSDGWDKDIAVFAEHTTFVKCRWIQDAHINGRTKYPARLY